MTAQQNPLSTKRRVLMITGVRLSVAQSRKTSCMFERVIEVTSPEGPEDIFLRANGVTDYILGGPEYVDADGFAQMPNLRRMVLLGTGTPSFIDENAARHHGVVVFNTPHLNADSVAEFALGMLIAGSSSAIVSADGVRSGQVWLQTPWRTLGTSRIGIVGLGHIGEALVRKLSALGVRNVAYASRARKPTLERRYGMCFKPLRALLGECDVVSLHVSYSHETHHLFNVATFAACNPDLRLYCFSNPRTIDPAAARHALDTRQLSQIYMDGYYREWTRNTGQATDEDGLLSLPRERFWATSHIAAQSICAIQEQLAMALRQLRDPA